MNVQSTEIHVCGVQYNQEILATKTTTEYFVMKSLTLC